MQMVNVIQEARRSTQGLLEAVSLEVVRKLRLASEAEAKDDRETILEEIFCDVTGLLDATAQSQLGACGPVPYYQVLAAYYATPKGADTAVALLHLLQGLYGQGYASPLVALLLHRWLLLRKTGRQGTASTSGGGTALRALPEEQRARLVHVLSLGSTQLFLGDVHRGATAFKPLWTCLAYEVVLGLPASCVPGSLTSLSSSTSPPTSPHEEGNHSLTSSSSSPLTGMALPAKTGLLAGVAAFMVYYADKEQLSDLLRWFPPPTALPPPVHILLLQQHNRRSFDSKHDRHDTVHTQTRLPEPGTPTQQSPPSTTQGPQQQASTPARQQQVTPSNDSAAAATREAADAASQHAARVAAAAAASAAGSLHDARACYTGTDTTQREAASTDTHDAQQLYFRQQLSQDEQVLSRLSVGTTASSLGEDEEVQVVARTWQWTGLDFIVLEVVDMLQRIRSEAGLVHYLAGVTNLKGQPFLVTHHHHPFRQAKASDVDAARAREALSTSARLKLQGSLYALSSPGGPHYPPRSVQCAAVAALDELFPTGRTSRAVVRTLFRLLHPADWVGDVLSGPVAAVQGVTARLALAAFMTLHRLLVFSGGGSSSWSGDRNHEDHYLQHDTAIQGSSQTQAALPNRPDLMAGEFLQEQHSHAAAGVSATPRHTSEDGFQPHPGSSLAPSHDVSHTSACDRAGSRQQQSSSWVRAVTGWLPASVSGSAGRLWKSWQAQAQGRHTTPAPGSQVTHHDSMANSTSNYGVTYHTPPGAAHVMPTT